MTEPSSPARILAPTALVLAFLAVAIVIGSSLGGDSSPAGGGSTESRATSDTGTGARTVPDRLPDRVYVVKPGDNFEGIAGKTGIPTKKLLELNPDLDPQALISGQRVRLR